MNQFKSNSHMPLVIYKYSKTNPSIFNYFYFYYKWKSGMLSDLSLLFSNASSPLGLVSLILPSSSIVPYFRILLFVDVAVVSGGGSPLCLSLLCWSHHTLPKLQWCHWSGRVSVRPAFTSDIHGRSFYLWSGLCKMWRFHYVIFLHVVVVMARISVCVLWLSSYQFQFNFKQIPKMRVIPFNPVLV